MSTALRGLALAVIVSSLAGCAASPYKAISPKLRNQVTATTGLLGIQQSEIKPTINYSGNGGGLIGAIISSSIDNAHLATAEKVIAPLRNALVDYDFDGQMLAAMQAQLPKVDWLHLSGVTLTKETSDDNVGKLITGAPTPYTLVVVVDYHLSPDFDKLVVAARAHLMAKPTASQQANAAANANNAIYDETVTYESTIPDGVVDAMEDKAEAAADADKQAGKPAVPKLDDNATGTLYWSQDGAAAAKKALTQGIAEVSRLLAAAMQNPYTLGSVADDVKINHVRGHIIEQGTDNRVVLQLEDGTVLSTDSSDLDHVKPIKH